MQPRLNHQILITQTQSRLREKVKQGLLNYIMENRGPLQNSLKSL